MSDAETIKLWLEADLAFDDGEGLSNPEYCRIIVRALLRAVARLDKMGENQLVSEIRATFEVEPGVPNDPHPNPICPTRAPAAGLLRELPPPVLHAAVSREPSAADLDCDVPEADGG